MTTNRRKSIYVCLALAAVVLIGIAVFCFGCNEKYTDVAVLSTTDMHGKGWDINLLTDQPEKNSMLGVATAAAKTREEFGEDNVILIDNGDLYQGTPFSQLSLTEYTGKEGSSVPSMSVCLEKAGYDAFIPGNHEFDYCWDIMSNVYKDLEENGIPVVTCNVCYDGSDGTHEKGDTVFTPYITKTIKVNGNEHKIGILGIGNTDITRWTDSANYPGMTFAHPDNQKLSAADEASMYIPEMKKEGCEFIIVSYHGGMGDSEGELEPLVNTNNQGERLAAGAEGIDLLITGHDHFSGYSNTAVTGPDGKLERISIENQDLGWGQTYYLTETQAADYRNRMIGIMVAHTGNSYYNSLFAACQSEAYRRGYVSMVMNTYSRPQYEESVMMRMQEMRPEAVIIAGGRVDLEVPDPAFMDLLRATRESVRLVVGSRSPMPGIPGVAVDHSMSMEKALRYLANLGHRKIGYVYAGSPYYGTMERLRTFRKVMAELGIEVREDWLVEGADYGMESGIESIRAMMSGSDRPTAVLGMNDMVSAGILQGLQGSWPGYFKICLCLRIYNLTTQGQYRQRHLIVLHILPSFLAI